MLTYTLAHFLVKDATGKPLSGVSVTVAAKDTRGEPTSITVKTGEDGVAIFGVPPSHLPIVPMDATFTALGPRGIVEQGRVKVGGNEHVHRKEIVLNVA